LNPSPVFIAYVITNNEFRIWPQIVLFQSLGKLKIEQRYRTELRFTSNGYRNRFRYRLGLSYPFGKEKNNYKPYQVSTSNEIFFTDNEPYFERNRMQFAFNYKPSKSTTLQVGYLHQFDYKINDETGRDFLQIGYFIEIF
jgi:long-subunit fatty acid transport protein